ncbi:MAG: PhzF family phenazine biosynthesis protein [Planctomycetes bacterium]|nr:PhzF family phenazine biosynthesis protein [Planctomycetota bacterium]
MKIPYFQVNAFTRQLTGGNPAGVCLIEEWLPDMRLQAIAACHLLPETAFLVPGQPLLRWFTPTTEVDLCGHATLATAHVLFEHRGLDAAEVKFDTRSGPLSVRRLGNAYEMDFPGKDRQEVRSPVGLTSALGAEANIVFDGHYLMAVVHNEETVQRLTPDLREIELMHAHAVMITAPGNDVDFVSRFFAPRMGVPEDYATGSAHCMMAPYWAEVLKKPVLTARQLSSRLGELECETAGERVLLRGHAVTFIEGHVNA